jgi:hypothetical protein
MLCFRRPLIILGDHSHPQWVSYAHQSMQEVRVGCQP